MKKKILISVCMMAVLGGWVMAKDDAILAPDQASKVNAVGWNLLNNYLAQGDDNIAISPASIRGAFCPLQYGLDGNTQKEVETVMGDGAVFDRFISQYNKVDNGAKLANRLVVSLTVPLNKEFLKSLPAETLKMADFAGNPKGECKSVNDWIEKNTNGMIKNMLTLDVFKSPDLKMLSINAAVFEGNWMIPFDEESNREEIFHGSKGDVKTTMMAQQSWGIVTKLPDSSTVIALPYAKPGKTKETSDICFVAVMPRQGVKLGDFVNNTKWDGLMKSFDRQLNNAREFNLTMPKFKIESPLLDLALPIHHLGVKDLFEPGKANFSKMTDVEDLFVSKIYHKCCVEVCEKGTKAAAATAVRVDLQCAPNVGEKIIVKLDRPFVWFIYDQKQHLVLFCGTYSMPENEKE